MGAAGQGDTAPTWQPITSGGVQAGCPESTGMGCPASMKPGPGCLASLGWGPPGREPLVPWAQGGGGHGCGRQPRAERCAQCPGCGSSLECPALGSSLGGHSLPGPLLPGVPGCVWRCWRGAPVPCFSPRERERVCGSELLGRHQGGGLGSAVLWPPYPGPPWGLAPAALCRGCLVGDPAGDPCPLAKQHLPPL